MASYTVMAKPEDATREGAIFVSDRFNGWAAVLGPLWALGNRMWIVAALLFCLMIGSGLLPGALPLAVGMVSAFATGLYAADLKIWSLARRGFGEQASVSASSLEEAELRFYASLPTGVAPTPAANRVVMAPMPMAERDPLGLFGTGG